MNKAVKDNKQDRFATLLLWGTCALLVSIVFLVNPFRETAVEDDWAYALTVKGLLDTGHYRAHDWMAANMPFQAYWGVLFSHFLGYSQASLRISTLVLAFFGLIAFYFLAIEHGLERLTAALLTLVLLSNPLFLLLSFSFMTDVPFLVLLILAFLFYTRSFRLRSYSWMILASIAASAAILTRQFGMCLVAGVFCAWFIAGRDRQDAFLVLVGLALPIAASIWQLYMGTQEPNWVAQYSMLSQWQYISKIKPIAAGVFWRPGVILQYLALFSMPLVLLAILAFPSELRSGKGFVASRVGIPETKAARHDKRLLIEIATYVVLCMLWVRAIMPILEWNFSALYDLGLAVRLVLTLVTTTGAVLYARIFVMRCLDKRPWATISPSQTILDFATLFLLLLHLVFAQIGDEYLLGLMPFTLIAVGAHLQKWLLRYRTVLLVTCLVLLTISAMLTRASLEGFEACWKGAELLRSKGVNVSEIYASFEWNCYHGAFDNYLADINHRPLATLKDWWVRWLPKCKNKARYLVADYQGQYSNAIRFAEKPADEAWEIIAEIPYRDILFRERKALVVKKSREE